MHILSSPERPAAQHYEAHQFINLRGVMLVNVVQSTYSLIPIIKPWAAQQCEAHHLIDLRGVVLLDVAQDADIVAAHKVDSHALAPVAPRAPNAVDVQLAVVRHVVVDHQRHLHAGAPG